MSGGRPAVYENRPVVEEATRGGWRSWKLPPKGAPCAVLDLNPRRQPVLARGRAPRRARPGAERAPVAARDLVAGERGLSAQGRVRAGQRRPPAAAPGHQPCRNWRIACGNCVNPSQASNDGQRFAPPSRLAYRLRKLREFLRRRSKRRPTFRSPGFRRELQ